jgi:hypothetical protein
MADLNATNRHSTPFRRHIRDANTYWEWDDDEVKPDGIGILGSGSDSTEFLDHFGIPILDSFSLDELWTISFYLRLLCVDGLIWRL